MDCSTDTAELVNSWKAEMEARNKTTAKNLDRLWPVLVNAKVTRVESRYDGAGDSGEYYGALYFMEDGSHKIAPSRHGHWNIPEDATPWEDAPTLTQTVEKSSWTDEGWVREDGDTKRSLHDAMDDIAYNVVYRFEAGWENNEGGSGLVIFDVPNKRVIIEHEQNVIMTESSRYEITNASV
tara:strand:+ start:639 stop:1181 length:543 start_codon:yes stop_codon:yes gene_type:complete